MKRSRVAHQVALKQIKLWALPDRKAESAPAESSSWSVMVSCGRDRDRACNRSRSKSADETGRTKEEDKRRGRCVDPPLGVANKVSKETILSNKASNKMNSSR